jgi:hypothetical protein
VTVPNRGWVKSLDKDSRVCASNAMEAGALIWNVRLHHAMSSIHTPQEKKRLALERDHYAKSKYDKARNGWSIKKHKARRSYRHATEALTKAAALDGESDTKIPAITQRPVRRWPVPSLRDRVARKIARRVRSIGAKKARRGAASVPLHGSRPSVRRG